jgi:hypothetical protein
MRTPRGGTPAYYIVFVMLLFAVAVFVGLFTQAVRRSTARTIIRVGAAMPVECPTGERAPACFRFDVTNLGPEAAEVACTVEAADGLEAEFLTSGTQLRFSPALQPGLSFTVNTKVVPIGGDTVLPPSVGCKAA